MIEDIEKTSFDYSKIEPNFIYNRIDLFDHNYTILHIINNNINYYIEIRLAKIHAELGVWLMHITKVDFKEISSYIFSNYPQIKFISFYNAISDIRCTKKKFFYLDLPSSYKEMEARLTSKSRQRLRRNKRDAAEKFGEMKLIEYNDKIPNEIVKDFFKLKKDSLNIEYNIPYQEYLNKYHVSNAYILSFGEKIAAIFFTCEQCPIVYGENFSYDDCFAYYSPGMIIYDFVIKRLIEKDKQFFFLGGGNYDYKRKYQSREISICEGRIYRNALISFKYHYLNFYNHHILWKIKSIKKKVNLSL